MRKFADASNSKTQQLWNVDRLLNRTHRRKTEDTVTGSMSPDFIAEGFTNSTVRTKVEKPGVKHISKAAKPVQDNSAVDSVKLMAVKEILAETKRAALRAELIASQRWYSGTILGAFESNNPWPNSF